MWLELGCVSAVDLRGRRIWIADALRGKGKRFIVRADEKLTASVELESAISVVTNSLSEHDGEFRVRRLA